MCEDALERYSTSMSQDTEILEKDKEARGQGKMTINKRNCVLFRRSEKAIFHFLKSCADQVFRMVQMTP